MDLIKKVKAEYLLKSAENWLDTIINLAEIPKQDLNQTQRMCLELIIENAKYCSNNLKDLKKII